MVTHSSVRAKNCSNISDAGHLTHWDGGKHVFYPPCPFHYQYPALGLHVSWCQCQPADYLLVAGPQPMGGLRPGSGPITWKLDLEQRPELIWITGPGSAGGALGGGTPIAGPALRSCKHVSVTLSLSKV